MKWTGGWSWSTTGRISNLALLKVVSSWSTKCRFSNHDYGKGRRMREGGGGGASCRVDGFGVFWVLS
jgi:hypothetical protein